MTKKLTLDPMGLGKALFATNLISGVAIVAAASVLGADMKSFSWEVMLAMPVAFAACGFVYGAVGATVYNMLSREAGHSIIEKEAA